MILFKADNMKGDFMKNKSIPFAGIIAAVLGIVFMFLGVYRGEANIVLAKAIRVCLECIGIG